MRGALYKMTRSNRVEEPVLRGGGTRASTCRGRLVPPVTGLPLLVPLRRCVYVPVSPQGSPAGASR